MLQAPRISRRAFLRFLSILLAAPWLPGLPVSAHTELGSQSAENSRWSGQDPHSVPVAGGPYKSGCFPVTFPLEFPQQPGTRWRFPYVPMEGGQGS